MKEIIYTELTKSKYDKLVSEFESVLYEIEEKLTRKLIEKLDEIVETPEPEEK